MRPEIYIDMVSNKFSIKKEQEKRNRFDDPQPFCWSIKSYQKNKIFCTWMDEMDKMDCAVIHGRRVDVVYWRVCCEWFLLLLNTTSNWNEKNKIFYELFFLLLEQKWHYTACQSLQSLQYVHHSDLKFIFISICFGIFDSDLEAKKVFGFVECMTFKHNSYPRAQILFTSTNNLKQ